MRLSYRKPSKYRAVPTVVDNIRFDSKREAARYQELKLLEKAGEIHGLERQVRIALHVHGVLIGHIVPDYRYRERDGTVVVEDVKSKPTMTALYRWKRKHCAAEHGITIQEV